MAGVELPPERVRLRRAHSRPLLLPQFLDGRPSRQSPQKVSYPVMYALESENKDAKIFNCVQRGHQNSLEMMPMFFVLMILGGIRHPLVCASLGLLYSVTRYFYFKGYSTGDPQKRLTIG
ncbi:microsomal glutathione s-transferase [Actinidia rufa]|uniref:Microsomal glutathione s-transferase n=1 Tax=Actinidia rufa TaxID=165716 RepID=A0A7J0ENA3_9ERIC|nr:microsomal glutathione s-transferase [Actinidia rufa]